MQINVIEHSDRGFGDFGDERVCAPGPWILDGRGGAVQPPLNRVQQGFADGEVTVTPIFGLDDMPRAESAVGGSDRGLRDRFETIVALGVFLQ